jgi:metal-sulfur cluster biosynthetic enzyme
MTFFNAETIREALKAVVDPELNVNVVDLGLIYDVKVGEEGVVEVLMTLTTPACPLGPQIEADVRSAVLELPGVKDAVISLTFDPPWSQEMISEDGRIQLGIW